MQRGVFHAPRAMLPGGYTPFDIMPHVKSRRELSLFANGRALENSKRKHYTSTSIASPLTVPLGAEALRSTIVTYLLRSFLSTTFSLRYAVVPRANL